MTPALAIGLKLAYVLVLHFVADWALQSKEMSRNKSLKVKVLLQHASIHLAVFSIGLLLITTLKYAVVFSLVNAVVHAFVDWYLWRAYKMSVIIRQHLLIPKEKWEEWGLIPKRGSLFGFDRQVKELNSTPHGFKIMDYLMKEFKYWDDYLFGFMLGFDQMLHGVCLVIIFALMFL